ncbi:MAG: hypothetical protein ACP5MD_06980, partial [Verrucomicrobiia bacterium]
ATAPGARPSRPHQPGDRSCTSFDHMNLTPERSAAGAGKNARAPIARWRKQRRRERGRLGRINPATGLASVSIT